MAWAHNGAVQLWYDEFGDPSQPLLVLVNGLGSQCINFPEEWCLRYAAEGFRVVRFDNRDVGLSTKLPTTPYSLADMATDVLAVMDAVGVERAHVLGLSMGGMIVQRLAIDHPHRVLSITSVMSRTGEPGHGDSTPEAFAVLTAAPATTREEYVERQVQALAVYGSRSDWIDTDEIRARAGAAFDRCFHPEGVGRQFQAVGRDGSRDTALRSLSVPALVIHGDRDTLITPSGGRHTAEVIPGARYVEIEGMGHDYPRAVWDVWVSTWAAFAREHEGG